MGFSPVVIFFIAIGMVLVSLVYIYDQSLKVEAYCIDGICITDPQLFHAQCNINTCVYNMDSPTGIQAMTHYRAWSFAGDCIYIENNVCQNNRLFYDNEWTRQDISYGGSDFVVLGRK